MKIYESSIYNLIHNDRVYDGIDVASYEKILDGQDKDYEFVYDKIKKTKPKNILEIGSWLGGATLRIASFLRDHSIDAKIVCVDTWLGPENLIGKNLLGDRSRLTSNGMPTAYWHFLANIKREGLQDYVVPFPQTSRNAMKFLSREGVHFDLIYVDGSSQYDDMESDMDMSWSVLSRGGVIVGENYNDFSRPQIMAAVNEFVRSNRIGSGFSTDKCKFFWSIKKKSLT